MCCTRVYVCRHAVPRHMYVNDSSECNTLPGTILGRPLSLYFCCTTLDICTTAVRLEWRAAASGASPRQLAPRCKPLLCSEKKLTCVGTGPSSASNLSHSSASSSSFPITAFQSKFQSPSRFFLRLQRDRFTANPLSAAGGTAVRFDSNRSNSQHMHAGMERYAATAAIRRVTQLTARVDELDQSLGTSAHIACTSTAMIR